MSNYPITVSPECSFLHIWWGGFGGFAEWGEFSPNTDLQPTDSVLDERNIEWLPTVGGGRGFAVREPNENRITGLRPKPPRRMCAFFYGIAARI